jgi:NAD(P)-dependent dehydrogenase (short-subunit alcohol dehydrogenase family)
VRVHLKGTFAVTRWAATYWRERTKAGEPTDARVINTSSGSGLFGNPGQANYGAAKAGIASFTIIAAMELERCGVTANAVSPIALTRMTQGIGAVGGSETDQEREELNPRWISPTVTWLASVQAAGITGRVFRLSGRGYAVLDGWSVGVTVPSEPDPTKIDVLMRDLVSKARVGDGRIPVGG